MLIERLKMKVRELIMISPADFKSLFEILSSPADFLTFVLTSHLKTNLPCLLGHNSFLRRRNDLAAHSGDSFYCLSNF